MKLADFICFEALIPELPTADRDSVIVELVQALANAGRIAAAARDDIVKMVVERENEASTGMGKGVAVPHVKHKAVQDVVAAVGRSSTGIDFSALDKKPVYSIILMISPVDQPEKHLQAMESVFKHLHKEKFRRFLRQAHTTEQMEDLIKETDENPLL